MSDERQALARAVIHDGQNPEPAPVVSAFIATALAQETPKAASAQWRAVAHQIRPKVPKLAVLLDEAEPDILAYMSFASSLCNGLKAAGDQQRRPLTPMNP